MDDIPSTPDVHAAPAPVIGYIAPHPSVPVTWTLADRIIASEFAAPAAPVALTAAAVSFLWKMSPWRLALLLPRPLELKRSLWDVVSDEFDSLHPVRDRHFLRGAVLFLQDVSVFFVVPREGCGVRSLQPPAQTGRLQSGPAQIAHLMSFRSAAQITGPRKLSTELSTWRPLSHCTYGVQCSGCLATPSARRIRLRWAAPVDSHIIICLDRKT